ncbi:MAG: alpha/beta fold hydrolase [Verrucomicrobiaceae bacterium]|nr:MAG: alpha/beta fold hydrolase [Verrucomicrobiaceae bacterium]
MRSRRRSPSFIHHAPQLAVPLSDCQYCPPLYTRIRPASEGAPVWLWVHGYTLDGSVWQKLWDHLPQVTHVAVDLPGHGRSAPLGVNVSTSSFASAVLHTAAECGATVLAGLSFGGTVALQAAIQEIGTGYLALILGLCLAGINSETRQYCFALPF